MGSSSEPLTEQPRASAPLLRGVALGKRFAAVPVLEDVSFSVDRGEILMLVGENGAGKSTLKNILSGLIAPDTGNVQFAGHSFPALNAADADRLGISTIHQELSLFENLSVAENIHLPHLPHRRGRIDRPRMAAVARAVLGERLGIEIDPWAEVSELSLGERQMVEIAKAIHRSSALLILDEPTTCLSLPERARLFEALRRLRTQGCAIIYITHFMQEVYELGDRVVALRDGRVVGDGTPAEISQERLVRLMVGRDLDTLAIPPPPLAAGAPVLLETENLADGVTLHGVSFQLRAGEILGIGGLMGAGRSEIAELLLGLRRGTGRVTLRSERFDSRSPQAALARGLVLVSEDRRRDQAFLIRAVRENATAAILSRLAHRVGILAAGRERAQARRMTETFHVQHPGLDALMLALSGGNQQKLVVGRWLQTNPVVCILDEPTKGVDIGARAEMHRLIRERAGEGMAFLLISSDLPELIGLAHRVLVMHKGRIADELTREEAEPHRILALASLGKAA
jgi:ABC-type sugar transport system ATPase subunit